VQSDEGYEPGHMRAESIPLSPLPARLPHSKRLLALAGDERLVQQIRAGSEPAFEVAFERHSPAILSFCRHMLGSVQEAEDAVQHTFASAYRTLLQDERPIRLKPWLFTIARNRSLSVLRARREPTAELHDIPTAGLSGQVEQRADLRDLLSDLHDLPDEQRAALLLAEVSDLSHAEVAEAIGCEVNRVKALVFRARSGLIERREARETPCDEIREQVANLRGGSLRRSELRHHLRVCAGCRDYREQVKRQRRLLGVALPVTPSLGLKSSVLSALGLGGGSAGGGGALAGSLGLASAAPVGASVAKVAALAVLVAGGAAAGERALAPAQRPDSAPAHAIQSVPGATRHAVPAASGAGAAAKPDAGRHEGAAARGRRRARRHAATGRPAKAHGRPQPGSAPGKSAGHRADRLPGSASQRSAPKHANARRSAPKHEPAARTPTPKNPGADARAEPSRGKQLQRRTDALTAEGG
jgi:RNA polymerase sigma factor (sigma-70 family)